MKHTHFSFLRAFLLILLCVGTVAAGDWPELRGPNRDGTSSEKNLPEKWSLAGENLLWRVPYGAISSPVVLGDRVYLQTPVGEGPTRQERLVCFDANTGKVLWERRFNITHSDVPPHRAAWASPGLDPETGNVYSFTVDGTLSAFTRDGKLLWNRYLTEEFGLITTHGGRTVSPMIDGPNVIVHGVSFNWGEMAGGAHRFFAFDKRTGETIYVSTPSRRPYDTTYSPAMITEVNGVRMIVAGGSDGAWYGIKASTGEPVWHYEVSKRGLNTGAIRIGDDLVLTHSEENIPTNEMGYRSLLPVDVSGEIKDSQTKWLKYTFLGGFSSPVTDGKRIYQVDNGALLGAFDAATGEQLWTLKLGTIQKGNAAFADGKIYVGTENGKFFILRPRADGCDILSEVELSQGDKFEEITSGPAISNGRIYFASTDGLYAIGAKGGRAPAWKASAPAAAAPNPGVPGFVQVVPADAAIAVGSKLKFRARVFDAQGNFIGERAAQWSLDQVGGGIQPDGTFSASEAKGSAGKVKATVGGLTGDARVRVIPPLPWNMTFDEFPAGQLPAWWINGRIKYAVKELEGNKVLTKLADNQFSFIRRARTFAGLLDWSNYTVESDIRFATGRRTLGDGGVVAQGYQLVIFGNHDKLELQSWQPETKRTVIVPFPVQPNTWYRMKLRVEKLADGSVRAQGKVWAAGETEPEKWTIERTDAPGLAILRGSPGLYSDAPFEVYFDNLKVTPNR